MIVATDIDETLTTSNGEWIQQLGDPSHIPAMRPEAHTLMQGYAELGYRVVYITARGEEPVLLDGRSSREATWDWLTDQGFPGTPEDLFLADGIGVAGDAAVTYKAGVLETLDPSGTDAVWAYGNAETDIQAFLEHGMDDAHIFLVGELAGTMGVIGLTDDAAYATHTPDQLAAVAPSRCAR
jgi:phosphatidate phosphatase PAH1